MGLLHLAPDGCATADALREGATAIDLDGYVSSLRLSLDVDLGVLTRMKNLSRLGVVNTPKLLHPEALRSLTALERFEAVQVKEADYTPLGELPALTHLRLEHTDDEKLPTLEGHPTLESLRLERLGRDAQRFYFSGAPKPSRSLRIADAPRLARVCLAVMPSFGSIEIVRCPSLTELELKNLWGPTIELRALPALRTLSIGSVESHAAITVEALGAIEALRLTSMRCDVTGILSAIKGSTTLASVDLSGAHFAVDLAELAALPSLTSLSLSYCNSVSDISALAAAQNLESLNLNGCSVTKGIEVLEALPKLRSLGLHGTGIPRGTLSERVMRKVRRP